MTRLSDERLANIEAHRDQLLSDAAVHEAEGRDGDAQTNYHAANAIDALLAELKRMREEARDLGNEIHNLGCKHQNDEDLANELEDIRSRLWKLAALQGDG